MGLRDNPYSSQYVEPARGGYLFDSPDAFPALLEQLCSNHWRGELVGVKGAGKSTLLTDILNVLRYEGQSVVRWQIRTDSRFYPVGWWRDLRRAQVLAIDGGEALLPGLLLFARVVTRLWRKGLLVTAHKPLGLPVQIAVEPNAVALSRKIFALLGLSPPNDKRISDLARRLNAHNGNAREVLFELYLEAEEAAATPGAST